MKFKILNKITTFTKKFLNESRKMKMHNENFNSSKALHNSFLVRKIIYNTYTSIL